MLFINFQGGGWLFPFYFGAAQFIKEYIDIKSENIKIGGVSAGSVTALMLLLEADFYELYSKSISRYNEAKHNPFKMKECLHDILIEYIPNDDEKIKNYCNKLLIGVSKIDLKKLLLKPHVLKDYNSKKTCIDIIKASCHIPIISGISPYYVNGEGYFDGEMAGMIAEEPCEKRIDIAIRNNNSINPGIKLPEMWAYYPVDPFVLKTLFTLGYNRTHQYFSENYNNIKPYIIKEFKPFNININNCIYETLEYCKKNNQVCQIRSPLKTIFSIFPGNVITGFLLWYALKKMSYAWKKFFAFVYYKTRKRIV